MKCFWSTLFFNAPFSLPHSSVMTMTTGTHGLRSIMKRIPMSTCRTRSRTTAPRKVTTREEPPCQYGGPWTSCGATCYDRLIDVIDVVPPPSSLTTEDDIRESSPSVRFNKACLKNVFTVVLIFVYLVLTAVAIFLAYQTISEFMEKLNNPVMSVTYKEVDKFSPPGLYD